MNDVKKSFVAAGWVAAAAGAVIVGSAVRDRVDLGRAPSEVDSMRGYVASRDNDLIPASDFFYELTEKLKKEYVEPVTDEQKLASGAVRGMIGSLMDPKSTYMDKDEFRAFVNARQGKYEGIGVDLALQMPTPGAKANRSVLQPTPSEESDDPREQALSAGDGKDSTPQFPRLTVTSVVPGGPADKAGVKPGDLVYAVDDHWVINADLAIRFRKAQRDFDAKKIPLSALNDVRKEVRQKYERALLPLRAKDRLFLGTSGAVKVVWERGGKQLPTEIQKAPSVRPGLTESGDTIQLPFVAGAPEFLAKAIAGKSAVTIDLRNNTLGDFGVMRQCLATLVPAGDYGSLNTERNEKASAFSIGRGNSNPPKITLLTDRTTRGSAEIFALALSSRGYAKLSGGETGGDRDVYDIVQLPDGAGYTLVTAHYKPTLPVKTDRVAKKGGRK